MWNFKLLLDDTLSIILPQKKKICCFCKSSKTERALQMCEPDQPDMQQGLLQFRNELQLSSMTGGTQHRGMCSACIGHHLLHQHDNVHSSCRNKTHHLTDHNRTLHSSCAIDIVTYLSIEPTM